MPSAGGGGLVARYRLHGDPGSSHQQIARLARAGAKSPLLDVGAAQGIFGQLLASSGLVMDAIEPHPTWAAAARPYYRTLYQSTIDSAELPTGVYQTVVCGDVIEHTADPVAALRRLRAAATCDALFIVSVPNVAHLAVRLFLLCGRFPRMERGILDRTHLQFFTRDSATELLRDAGLRVDRVHSTGVPLEEVWPGQRARALYRVLSRLQRIALVLAPRVFAYQWIFVAHPA